MEEPSPYRDAADSRIPKLLFVPGIDDDEGDLDTLKRSLDGIATMISIRKEDVGFEPKKRHEWEDRVLRYLKILAEAEEIDGLVGHSFGCFRTLHLLEQNVRASFAILLNPPLNSINKDVMSSQSPHYATNSETEKRLWSLVLDLPEDQYREFMFRHARYEQQEGPLRPWQVTEFKTLSKEKPLPDLLRAIQPPIPIDIVRSPCDPWDIKDWGDLGMNVRQHAIDGAGHYLQLSKATEVLTIIRCMIEETIRHSPHNTPRPHAA